jgi:hypothetical protein
LPTATVGANMEEPLAIDERLRLSIHTKLSALIGDAEADALITHIMPVPWNEVATRDDLRLTASELRADMATMRADLRSEMADLRTELRADMADLRTELHQGMAAQTRWLTGYMTALSAVMLSVARLVF